VLADFQSLTSDDVIFVGGDYDAADSDGITPGGAYEYESYIVYVVNDEDFAWNSSDPSASTAADRLEEYLNTLIAAGDTRPVFIASHRPLHYSMRTYKNEDNLYGKLIFDVLNEAGEHGLNLIYLYGHNHNGWDSYLGQSCVYLEKGDTIYITDPYDNTSCVKRTLNFTYLNAGYLSTVNTDSGSGDNTSTFTVYEIYSDRVEISRISTTGKTHNVKCAGGWSKTYNSTEQSVLGAKGITPYQNETASPAAVELTPVVQELEKQNLPALDGQTYYSVEELYPGVTATEYYLEEGSKYGANGNQYLRVIEFDPTQSDLAVDVVEAGDACNEKATVPDIVEKFNSTNTENKTVIAAVNGDLWMMAEYHSRVEGVATLNGYSDAVVKQELCLPRGYVVVDGEIICSQNMTLETPFEERFQSFGITSDGTPLIGDINTKIFVTNDTKGTSRKQVNGLNRLPVDGALVVYSDKGPISNYALDDAYEVIIDCDYDYRFFDGETITGTVTAVSQPGEERYAMQENRIILTARGKSPISRISNMEVGDQITLTVSISDSYGNTAGWRTVTEAVGGHIPPVRGGIDTNTGIDRADPMTLVGYKADGTVVTIVNDGRSEYSAGINRTLFDELCIDLGIDTAMLLDGGGSTTLVELSEQGYELKNRPSDGSLRAVVNSLVLSYVSDDSGENTDPPEANITLGDVNLDGKISAVDIAFLKRAASGIIELTEDQRTAADVNGDKKVNSVDLLMIKRMIAGLLSLTRSE
jgi:hypothetical protein